MMPILYLLGGVVQLIVAVGVAKAALPDWRDDQVSTVLGLMISALFTLCAFLMFIQVQP